MRRGVFGAVVMGIILTAAANSALADPDQAVPSKVSEKLAADLSKADLEAASADASKYIGQAVADNFKNTFASIKNLGQSQYTDVVYSRD